MMPLLLVTLTLRLVTISPGEQHYGTIETRFDVTIRERTEFPPGLEANLRTTSVYPCTGYEIRTRVSWKSDTLTVSIGGLLRPAPCIPVADRATGRAYLGDIGDGRYILRIVYRGEEDLYRIRMVDRFPPRIESMRRQFTTLQTE